MAASMQNLITSHLLLLHLILEIKADNKTSLLSHVLCAGHVPNARHDQG